MSRVVPTDELLPACFDVADRIDGWSRPGVELTKRMLWNSLDAISLESHMDAEGTAQLFVRITTRNFEEAMAARTGGPDARLQGLTAEWSSGHSPAIGRHLEVVSSSIVSAGEMRPISQPSSAPSM